MQPNLHAVNNQHDFSPRELSPKERERYFESPPRVTKLLVVGSILLVLVFMCGFSFTISNLQALPSSLFMLMLFSIPLDIGIVRLILFYSIQRPTDEEYEAWVNKDRQRIQQYGLKKLGLTDNDVSGRPLNVRGIVWPGDSEAMIYHNHFMPVKVKLGKDGRIHGSINRFTFFYPTDHFISVFTLDVNALHPFQYEGTQIYYYNDIVGVETNGLVLSAENVSGVQMQRFSLRISSGQAIGTSVMALNRELEDTINSLRTLLRNKKFGTQGGERRPAGY